MIGREVKKGVVQRALDAAQDRVDPILCQMQGKLRSTAGPNDWCKQQVCCTAPEQPKASDATTVPGSGWHWDQAAPSSLQSSLTRLRRILTVRSSRLSSNAATNSVLPDAPRPQLRLRLSAQRECVNSLLHHLLVFVFAFPRVVVAYRQLPQRLQRQDSVLRLRHKVLRQAPHMKRQLCTRRNLARCRRALVPEAVLLVKGTPLNTTVSGMLSSWADRPVRRAPRKWRFHTSPFAPILVHELCQTEAFRKLNLIACSVRLTSFRLSRTLRTAVVHWLSLVRNRDRVGGHLSMLRLTTFVTLATILFCSASASATKTCDDLFDALYRGEARRVATLLAGGADPNCQGGFHHSPLHEAVFYYHANRDTALEAVEMLLAAGGDPNRLDDSMRTPLHWAIESEKEGAFQLVRALLRGKADPNLRDADGLSPLHFAAYVGDGALEIVNALLEAKADPSLGDVDGVTPLHISASSGDHELARAFLAAGVSPNLKGQYGATPLHDAAFRGDKAIEVVKLVLAAGGDPNRPDHDGATPLHWATSRGDEAFEVVVTLLAAGADPNRRDNTSSTPLHSAVARPSNVTEYQAREHLEVVKILLEVGANVTAQDEEGRTPLHRAVANGKLFTVRMLTFSIVDRGKPEFDLGVLDRKGESATALARHYAGLPSKIEPEMEYRKRQRECTDEEKRRWEKSLPRRTLGDVDLIPIEACPKKIEYRNMYGDILYEDDVIEISDGINRGFVARSKWIRANPKEARYSTSPEISRFLEDVGGEDWTEKYLMDVRDFRHGWKMRRLELARRKLSFRQQKFDFEESKRRARREELMAEIRRKQERARAAEMQALAAGANEREKRNAEMEKLELLKMEETYKQLVKQGVRVEQMHRVEIRRLEEEMQTARRNLRATEVPDGGETGMDHGQGGDGSSVSEGGQALETMEPLEGPADEGG